MLGEHEGSPFAFAESRRPDGRAASASRSAEGQFSFSASGSSPQGEEQSLLACKLLVDRFNSLGGDWDAPSSLDGNLVDCQAKHRSDPGRVLQVQVVRAIMDQGFWRTLNTQGATQQSDVEASALASALEKTIKTKATRIATSALAGLTLVLDATLVPVVAFDHVIEEFLRQHGVWAGSLGFEAVWVVGPLPDLVHRLDRSSSDNIPDAG